MKVDKVETEISSIPDMWARPLLFEMALLDTEHVLHDRIHGEWRGLLAMIALKDVLKLDRLTVSPITLPVSAPVRRNSEEQEEEAPGQRDFLQTLSKLLPKATLASDTSWRSLYVFLFNGKPIGMTSPTTLVATATDYLDRISSQEVSWYKGAHLKDPVPFLPPRYKEILSGWLTQLIAKLDVHPDRKIDRWDLLSGLLGTFRDQLGAGTCSLSQSGFGMQGKEAGVFKYLDKPADGNLTDESHVKLIPSAGRSPVKPLLVFDRGIAEQWDMSLQDVTVDGAQTLASTKVTVKDADVWKGADFFTKTLFVIFQENAFPGTQGTGTQSLTLPGGSNSVTPILPLRWELMQHLTSDDLAQRVRWDQTPDGLRIRLFLKLSGPDLNNAAGRTIELTKLYRREEIQTLDNVPILEVWPNFKAPDWKAYYTCFSTDDARSTFAAKPYAPGQSTESEVPLTGRGKRRYWRTENYPEAMVCRASIANAQTNQMEHQDAGLLLLTQPEPILPRGKSYRVGIDFGAASTTVCARVGEQRFPVKFAERKLSVTASGDIAQAQLTNFFLPKSESEMPLLSFFQSFENSHAQQFHPFLNGHIYLLPGAGTFDANQPGLALDLKWSSDDSDRRMVKAFLAQLCLQTAAELVVAGASKASWAFSYPTAFSAEQMVGFSEIWNQVTSDCVAQSGLSRTAKNEKQTESVAAALYFVNHLSAATAVGTIFIDIGGSTSDISIWQNDKPVWQTSVLLAGRNIFSNYLWHHPDFLGLFGVGVSELPDEKGKSKSDKKPYYALTDALLRYNSNLIFTELPVHAGTQQVKALQQHLALGVAGLFYYVGSLLRYLMQIRVYYQNIPNVYVGGNGSRIFRWLDIDGDGLINMLYKTVFSQAAGLTDDQAFNVILSPEPKMEAAYGLVSDSSLQGGNQEGKVLAGECFVAEGTPTEWPTSNDEDEKDHAARKLPWNTTLTPESFTRNLAPPEKLERLPDFLIAFNQFARTRGLVSTVDMSKEETKEIINRLGQSLSRYRNSQTTANIVVEPIFIMALRHWLEIRLGG
ncbi:MAG: hypothetical protein H7Z16_13605 [Pyrinomonadaceae bacterium]|nr:hypothetical protein [Pyrinomonadaceae bacterium]